MKASETFYLTIREALCMITGKVNEATGPGGSAPRPDRRQANTSLRCRKAVLTPRPASPTPVPLSAPACTKFSFRDEDGCRRRPPWSRGEAERRGPAAPSSRPARRGPGPGQLPAMPPWAPRSLTRCTAPHPPTLSPRRSASRAARQALPPGGYRCPRRRPGRPAPL